MRLSLRRGRPTAAAALAACVAAVGLLSAGCTPANTSSKIISGTIQGADGKIVDALIGFEVTDALGHHIDLGGAGTGYSVLERMNHCVPTSGAKTSQQCYAGGKPSQVTTKNWSLKLPSNAAHVWIEVYPKEPSPSAWIAGYNGYTGPSTGRTNVSTYATSERAQLAMGPSGLSNVRIVLPKVCTAGGTTGSISGQIAGWPIGHTGSANAWSLAPNSLPDQGFATGSVDASGHYTINNLQSGQRYGLIIGGPGYSKNLVDYRRATSPDTLVKSCTTTTFNIPK